MIKKRVVFQPEKAVYAKVLWQITEFGGFEGRRMTREVGLE